MVTNKTGIKARGVIGMEAERRTKTIAAVLIVMCSVSILFHLQDILDIFIRGINYPLDFYIRLFVIMLSIFGVIVVYAFWEKPKPKGIFLTLIIVETLRRLTYCVFIFLLRLGMQISVEEIKFFGIMYNIFRSGCLVITIIMTAILIQRSCKKAKLILVTYLIYAILSLAQPIIQILWLFGSIEVLRDVLLILSLTAAVIYAVREVKQSKLQLHHKEI